ncbi:MAG: ABC transporter substrate-binding protein [Deltaproteobacteria bacterium]|nr:ABC transporter substrate-binding protein [Deltaproteobacteria bacterium]
MRTSTKLMAIVTLAVLIAIGPATARGREMNVGYLPIYAFLNYFVAIEAGYFQAEGFTIKLHRFTTGGDMIVHLARGTIDAGGGAVAVSFFNGVADGLQVKAVGTTGSQPKGFGASPILVRKALHDGGHVRSPADLRGRPVALNAPRGTAEYLVARALGRSGLSIDDVRIVTLPFPEMPKAFERGAIDAGLLPDPFAASTLEQGTTVVLVKGDEIVDNPQNGLLYYGKNFLEDRSDVPVRFTAAIIRALREINRQQYRGDEILKALTKYTRVPPHVARKITPYFLHPDNDVNLQSLMDFQAYYMQRRYLKYQAPLKAEQLFDGSFNRRAVERLGPYRP